MEKMMKILVFLVAIHLLVHEEVKALYAPFDYFVFVLQWPPSLCNDNKGCKRPPDEDFSIHGLWPSNLTGALLRRCYKVPYDPSVMSDELVQRLHLLWKNNRADEDDSIFWETQWNQHGVCSLIWYEQKVYFHLATKLRDKFHNFKSDLIDNGIVPGRGLKYSLDFIAAGVQKVTTKVPDFYCNYDKRKNFQLNEILICHTSGGDIMDCPLERSANSCGAHKSIYFPLPLR